MTPSKWNQGSGALGGLGRLGKGAGVAHDASFGDRMKDWPMTNKTVETAESVGEFLAGVADDEQRADAAALIAVMERLSGEPARLWGPSIIGFGTYHYTYDSGRTGSACRIGFSPRKGKTVLYLADGFAARDALLSALGKHKTGKACLYIKRLSDVDCVVLEQLCQASLDRMNAQYPTE